MLRRMYLVQTKKRPLGACACIKEFIASLGIADMRRALRDFFDKSREADVAVIYYGGHDGVATLQRDDPTP